MSALTKQTQYITSILHNPKSPARGTIRAKDRIVIKTAYIIYETEVCIVYDFDGVIEREYIECGSREQAEIYLKSVLV